MIKIINHSLYLILLYFLLSTFTISYITFTGGSCDEPDTTGNPPSNYYIDITSISPTQIVLGQSFTVNVSYNLPQSYTIHISALLYLDNGTCVALYNEPGSLSGYGTTSYSLSSSLFSSSGQGCSSVTSFDNKAYEISIGAGTSQYVGSNRPWLIVGSLIYNIEHYNAIGMTCLPYSWTPVNQAFSRDCNTILSHPDRSYNPPCLLQNGQVPNGPTDLGLYMVQYFSDKGWTNSNYNKAFLLGMCQVDGFSSETVGYTLMRVPNPTAGAPAGCFVFVNKIDNFTQYTYELRNKLKTERAAHELGHGRGISGHIDHTTNDGTNWNRCCMKAIIYPEEVNNYYGPYFCGTHSQTIKKIWW